MPFEVEQHRNLRIHPFLSVLLKISLACNLTLTLRLRSLDVFYWLTIVACLVYLKFKEGRVAFGKFTSRAYKEREAARLAGGYPSEKDSNAIAADPAPAPALDSPTDEKAAKLERSDSSEGSRTDEAELQPVKTLCRIA